MSRGISIETFPDYVNVVGDCWLWRGLVDRKGYGRVTYRGRSGCQAHRVAYEMLVGPIPDGLELDHLCRVHACINPEHLEPVTQQENRRRSPLIRPSHCQRGHELTDADFLPHKGVRQCVICRRAYGAEWARQKRSRLKSAA